MSRSDNMAKLNKKWKNENNIKVKRYLTGFFVEELKKVNGKWNISKIARELNLSRPTISRIIKEERL